jgi:predicted ATPase
LAVDALLLALVEDNAALEKSANALAAVTTEQGFAFWGVLGTIYRGWVKVRNGGLAEGISLLQSGLVSFRASGMDVWTPCYMAFLARAYAFVGQVEEASALFDDALQIVERTGARWFAAELHRHKGQLLLQQGHIEDAEELYRKALVIARKQEAKLWELRAATNLARLWNEQGRRGEAHDLLAPVYNWFTEGFDTADLKDAKALLDELA